MGCESLFSAIGGDFYFLSVSFTEPLMTLYDMILVWVRLHCAKGSRDEGYGQRVVNITTNSVSGLISPSANHSGAFLGVGQGQFNFLGLLFFSCLSTFLICKIKDLVYISGFQMFFSCRNFCFLKKNLSGPRVYLQKTAELLWKFRVQVCVVWYVFMLRPLIWNDPYTFSHVQDYVNLRAVQMFYWSILFNKSLCYSTACCVLVSSRVEAVNVRHSYFFSRCMLCYLYARTFNFQCETIQYSFLLWWSCKHLLRWSLHLPGSLSH